MWAGGYCRYNIIYLATRGATLAVKQARNEASGGVGAPMFQGRRHLLAVLTEYCKCSSYANVQ